mmetsp:Transcript_20826/g.67442  ORF Transcript_20826/g.67442 Transcript_20826/m.67442 type:complete len:892 (+) Transcript_20826:7-2682(+)
MSGRHSVFTWWRYGASKMRNQGGAGAGGGGRGEEGDSVAHDARIAERLLDAVLELVRHALGITEQHVCVVTEEERVGDVGVASAERALHDDGFPGLPDADDGHAGELAVRVFLGGGIHGVVGADDERDVKLVDGGVHLLHLLDDVVRHARLGEEDVELAGHAAGDGVDRDLHLLAVRAEQRDELRHRVLPFGDGEAVPGDDEHLVGADEVGGGGVDVAHDALARLHVAAGVDGGAGARLGRRLDRKKDGDDATVHRLAHDQAEDGAGGADEGADDGEELAPEHKALGAERPAAVGVQARDDDGHVRGANRGGHVHAEHARNGGGDRERGEGGAQRHAGREHHREAVPADGEHGEIAPVLERERKGLRGDEALELAERHDGAGEGDGADEGAGPDGDDVGWVGGGVEHGARDGGARGGGADERVERGNQLWEVGDGERLGDADAHRRADGERPSHLRPARGERGGGDGAEGGSHAERDAHHPERVAEARRLLRREPCDRADAAQARGEPDHRVERRRRHAHDNRPRVRSHGGGETEVVEDAVLRRVLRALEHREHAARHHKAACDVDGGDEDGARGDGSSPRGRHGAARDELQAAESCDTADGVRDAHERGVERGLHARDAVVAHHAREEEGGDEGDERRARPAEAEGDEDAERGGDGERRLGRGDPRGRRLWRLFCDGDRLRLLLDDGLRGGGLLRRRRRRPRDGAHLGDERRAHGVILVVDEEAALLRVAHREEEVGEVVGEERGGGARCAAHEVSVANHGDAVRRLDHLVLLGADDVAARGCGEVHRHGARLEERHRLVRDEGGSLLARDERRRDNNVALRALLLKESHFSLDELLRHLLGVPARALARLLDVDGEKLGAHRLNLLARRLANVKRAHDGAHVLRRLNRR